MAIALFLITILLPLIPDNVQCNVYIIKKLMPSKIRKQFYIEPRQQEQLKATMKKLGISEAEIVRQTLDSYMAIATNSNPNPDAWQTEKIFIAQVWQRPSLPGGRDWHREDLYER
jgi:hypothetical protein